MGRIGRYCRSISHGLVLHKGLQLLESMGILIQPYYFYREILSNRPKFNAGIRFEGYEFLEAGAEQIEGIAGLNPRTGTRASIRREFGLGRRCFAIRLDGKIVTASWCDTREIHFPPCRRDLGCHEAYIYRTETLYPYRGHGLAPCLRSMMSDLLFAEGREVLFSYTERFNYPAIRLKEKIGARIMFVGLHIRLFGSRGRSWVLGRTPNANRSVSVPARDEPNPPPGSWADQG